MLLEGGYFAVTINNSPLNKSDKMDLLNQILEWAKFKDKELWLERSTMEEDEGKTKNSPWLERTEWKMMFVGQDMKDPINFTNKDIALELEYIIIMKINDKSYLVIFAFNDRIGFIKAR